MKIAIVQYTDRKDGTVKVTNYWVHDDAEIGDKFGTGRFGLVRVTGFEGDGYMESQPQKTETVNAEDLKWNDEIYYDNEWRTVLGTYLHPKSPYNKLNVSQPNSTIPLSLRLDRKTKVERKTENFKMSIALLNLHELVKQLQAKLIDLSALNSAPDRIEALPSVFIDKGPVMSALKAEIKDLNSKIEAQVKKL